MSDEPIKPADKRPETWRYPTPEEADAFALMLQSGLPAGDAICYFTDSSDPVVVGQMVQNWQRSRLVKKAIRQLMGKNWQDMTPEEKLKTAIDKHYTDLAYMLWSRHYLEADAGMKGKLDSARTAIEAKLAGQAGRTDALTRFFDDISSGRLNLPGIKPSAQVH